jgi:uncharacterized protein
MSTQVQAPTTNGPATLSEAEAPAAPAVNPLAGNPGMVGIPTVIAGAIGLGLVDTGFVPASAGAAAIPIVMTATSSRSPRCGCHGASPCCSASSTSLLHCS